MRTNAATRFDVGALCERVQELTKGRRHFESAHEYAEPGYGRNTPAGIIFGNWNPVCEWNAPAEVKRRDPVNRLARILEKLGFELEWEDEWTTCGNCGKAVRTQPDSYSWTPSYVIYDECELICSECVSWPDYLESIEDKPRKCCPPDCDPTEFGYVKFNGTFENGWHPGQNDDPRKILEAMHADGMKRVVFRHSASGQFDVEFEAYYKPDDSSDDE
jgi:hypothetical protein